jgi:hypothetical protein
VPVGGSYGSQYCSVVTMSSADSLVTVSSAVTSGVVLLFGASAQAYTHRAKLGLNSVLQVVQYSTSRVLYCTLYHGNNGKRNVISAVNTR